MGKRRSGRINEMTITAALCYVNVKGKRSDFVSTSRGKREISVTWSKIKEREGSKMGKKTELYGCIGKALRVNLTDGTFIVETLGEDVLRKYVGGTGIGAMFLYQGVPQGVEWSASGNQIIFASGPLGGTTAPGSGTFSVVTKGAITSGATSSQANGFLGAYMKRSGFDAVVIEGASKNWVYLYIHDGKAELIKADHLVGKDTWKTEDAIKSEIDVPESGASVFGIGPAGENLVRFAAIVGDRGHVASHNGVGAVMGSKKLKAIVAGRGKKAIKMKNKEMASGVNKEIIKVAKSVPPFIYDWGTSVLYDMLMASNELPIKNLTTAEFPEYVKFIGQNYRPHLELKRSPCWSCQARHCHIVKVLEGPYAGYIGEEPEYEAFAAWGSLIGQTDVGAAIMLSNETDRLGLDANEAGWLTAMLMECYEKGIINKNDADGLELTWGNAEAVRSLLHKIAYRQGFGNTLAEGIMRASEAIGGEAPNIGVFVKKGNSPRGHDHRAGWVELFDTATSNVGTLESGGVMVADPLSPQEVSMGVAKCKGTRFFKDSLGVCILSTGGYFSMPNDDPGLGGLVALLNAVTGWDFSPEEAMKAGLRAANTLRMFNLRHGITPELELPSTRYGSAPAEGRAKGKTIMPYWNEMLDTFYQQMGWDRNTGKPLPDTLRSLGLGHLVADL